MATGAVLWLASCNDAPSGQIGVTRVPAIRSTLSSPTDTPDPNALTVYVVRQRWGDQLNQVPITVDGGSSVLTVPGSIIRLRLPPGSHKVEFTWEGKAATHAIEGKAGELRFVQLAGSVWSWGSSYTWQSGDADDSKRRALRSRLIADIPAR